MRALVRTGRKAEDRRGGPWRTGVVNLLHPEYDHPPHRASMRCEATEWADGMSGIVITA